jgi:hypothetical protein
MRARGWPAPAFSLGVGEHRREQRKKSDREKCMAGAIVKPEGFEDLDGKLRDLISEKGEQILRKFFVPAVRSFSKPS